MGRGAHRRQGTRLLCDRTLLRLRLDSHPLLRLLDRGTLLLDSRLLNDWLLSDWLGLLSLLHHRTLLHGRLLNHGLLHSRLRLLGLLHRSGGGLLRNRDDGLLLRLSRRKRLADVRSSRICASG